MLAWTESRLYSLMEFHRRQAISSLMSRQRIWKHHEPGTFIMDSARRDASKIAKEFLGKRINKKAIMV